MSLSVAVGDLPERTRTRPRRRWLRWLLFGLALLAAAYTALWFYAAGLAGRAIDAWMATEARNGRAWTCTDRRISGYPLQLAIGCRTFGFEQHAAGGTKALAVAIGPVAVSVALYDPNRVTAEVDGPLHMRSDRSTVTANWTGLRVDASGLLGPVGATLRLTRPQVQVAHGGMNESMSAAEATLSVLARDGGGASAGSAPAAEVRLAVGALLSPRLDSAFDNSAPMDVDAVAQVSNAPALRGPSAPEALEHWRQSGGKVDIESMNLVKGDAHIGLKGRVGLDEERRLQGGLKVNFAGLDSMMQRSGVPIAAVNIGGLLLGLLGDAPMPGDADRGSATTLPLTLADGHVSLGPVPLPVHLTRLY